MARIAIIDQVNDYARMLAIPFAEAGHTVIIATPPATLEHVAAFEPELLFVCLYRRARAATRPITSPLEDLAGYGALIGVEHRPELCELPRVLIGHCVDEDELPASIDYDLYLACQVEAEIALPIAGQVCLAQLPWLLSAPKPKPEAEEEPMPEHEPYTAVIIQWTAPSPH